MVASTTTVTQSTFAPPRVAAWRRPFRRLVSNRGALAGCALLLLLIFGTLCAPLLAPTDPAQQQILRRLKPPLSADGGPPLLMGSDQLGRDIWSRVLFGARVSLAIGFIAAALATVLGAALGLIAGFYGGRLGMIILRLADVQHSFPFLIIAIVVVAVVGPSLGTLIVTLTVWGWVAHTRVVRGEVLAARERDYVVAARALGASDARLLVRHILPNVISPLIVLFTFLVAQLIIAESSLGFLGLGVQPPTPSWGSMLADGRVHVGTAWWLATFPGLAIMLTVLSINLLGDGLRDALDPRLTR
jgi:peptide/nickel transport system permease protein